MTKLTKKEKKMRDDLAIKKLAIGIQKMYANDFYRSENGNLRPKTKAMKEKEIEDIRRELMKEPEEIYRWYIVKFPTHPLSPGGQTWNVSIRKGYGGVESVKKKVRLILGRDYLPEGTKIKFKKESTDWIQDYQKVK